VRSSLAGSLFDEVPPNPSGMAACALKASGIVEARSRSKVTTLAAGRGPHKRSKGLGRVDRYRDAM